MAASIGLITMLTVLLMISTVALVGRARGRYGVKAPATTGPDGFERALRVQGNTFEASLMFLPALWTAALFAPGLVWLSAPLGALWLLARVWYALAYANPSGNRGPAFALGALANLLLVGLALWGIAWTWILA